MASLRCLLASLLVVVVSPAAAQKPVPAGQAVAVAGSASVIRVQSRVVLRQGAMVHVGERVVTGPNARVRIKLVDGATLVVGPRSEVVVRGAGTWGRQRSISLRIIFGIARAVTPPNHRSALEIWTSTAIASVRHTDWIVAVRSDRTAVFAVDGSVDVTDRRNGQARVLQEGDGIDLLADGRVLGPRRWGAARVARVTAATTLP